MSSCLRDNCHDRAETAASHWVTPSALPGLVTALAQTRDSWLTDWLWTWLKLANTRWPTWAVLVRLWLQAHCQCGASLATWTWTWLCEVSSCSGNLISRCQPTHYSRSIHCSKSVRGIKSVAVQLDTHPQFVGGGKARGGRAPGQWRPQTAPASREGDVISENQMIS